MSDTAEPVQPTVVPVQPTVDPGEFGPGSFAPASDAPVLSLKDRLRQSPETQKVSGEIQGVKGPSRRTRTAKPKEDDGKKSVEDLERERRRKKARSDDIAQQITGEFNDMVLRFFISQGVPAAALYQSGHAPAPVAKTANRYTEAGAKIAVDDFTASMVGSFLVEFESSDLGSQIVGKATGGPVALVVKGLVAGACVVGYLNGLKQVNDRLQPLIQANQQHQRQQAANRQDQQRPIHPEGPQ